MGNRAHGWDVWVAVAVVAAGLAGCGLAAGTTDSLPGAEPYAPDLRARLAAALAARGGGYEPRTHHLREDGSPAYTNRLILESSPYLGQHAHNPVDWYPWGDAAFEAARRLGRPVLLSVGYSTCHWCHVMESESFEDLEIARYLNENYVAIKVDREERPDVDSIYMTAVQAIAGRGGWPMTVWLTPDRQPFYAGTYIPARDGDRGVRAGFLTMLRELRQRYDEDPETVAGAAGQLSQRIKRYLEASPGKPVAVDAAILKIAAGHYPKVADPTHGGMRGSPKFPSSIPVRFLLRYDASVGDAASLRTAEATLAGMAAGGLHDQIGGGFHRYSVDDRWLVPHFEKMLYDNALLAVAYLEGYQATGRGDFAAHARRTLDYVAREMTSPEGGFYSATDADSLAPTGHMEEGWFFTWTPTEIAAVLDEDLAPIVREYYGVTERGNLDGRNVLHVARTPTEIARTHDLPVSDVEAAIATSRDRLYAARSERPAPLRDEKILAAWNGLMISAFARGGFVLGEARYLRTAERAAGFVLGAMRVDGRLRRSYKDGSARHAAYLDDYAFVIAGLLDLYEATWDRSWLRAAMELQAVLDLRFRAASGGYFFTANDHEKLLAREKPSRDGAVPSGNSVTALNLVRLHAVTADDAYRRSAAALFDAYSALLRKSPASLSEMLLALDLYLAPAREVILVAPESLDQVSPFLDVLRREFFPSKVVVAVVDGKDRREHEALVPPLAGKVARRGMPTAYVCRGGVCELPTTEVEVFRRQLETVRSPGGE